LCPFRGGELGAHLTQYGQAEVYFHTKKWRLGPSSLLATADMGRKLGAVNMAWAEAYLRSKWHLDPFSRLATTGMGRKLEVGLCPFGGSWVPI